MGALAPLGDVTSEPDPKAGDPGAGQPTTFRERKLQQLNGEPEPTPGRPDEPSAESVEDGYPEDDPLDVQGFEDDEDAAGDPDLELDEALDESPESEEEDGAEEDDDEELTVEQLKEKNLHLQQELSRVTANRKKNEQDFSDGIAENMGLRHQLEDTLEQQQQQGQFWLQLANQQVAKFEQLDWTQVPPEKLAGLRQQAQQAMVNRNQIIQHFQQLSEQGKQAIERVKDREAEIARNQLVRVIPNWGNELYGKLREFAVTQGYNTDDFNDITDARVMRLLYRAYESEQAGQKVQRVKRKQKARVPRNRNAKKQPRNAQGRFKNARDEAFSNPGDKGSFREMKLRQLESEQARGVGR